MPPSGKKFLLKLGFGETLKVFTRNHYLYIWIGPKVVDAIKAPSSFN